MRNLLRGLCVLGAATVLLTAFLLVFAFTELSSVHGGTLAAYAALFGGMLVAAIGIVLGQVLIFRNLLHREQERSDEILLRKIVTEADLLEVLIGELKEVLIGELKVISARITQVRQSVDDMKS